MKQIRKILTVSVSIIFFLILISGLIISQFYKLPYPDSPNRQQIFTYLSQLLAVILFLFSAKMITLKRSWDYVYLNLAFMVYILFNLFIYLNLPGLIQINSSALLDLYSTFNLLNLLIFSVFIFLASVFSEKIIERSQLHSSVILSYSLSLIFLLILVAVVVYLGNLLFESNLHEDIIHLGISLTAALLLLLACIPAFRIYIRKKFLSHFWFMIASGCFLFAYLYHAFNFVKLPLFSEIIIILQGLGFLGFFFVIFNEHARFLETETKIRTSLETTLSDTESNLQNFQNLIDEIAVGVMVLDSDGKIIFCNRQWVRMLGIARKNLIGISYSKLVNQENLEKFQLEQEKWREGVSSQIEMEFLKKDATKLQVLMVSVPILNRKKHYLGSRHVTIEISRWKEIEKNLLERSDNLEKIIQQRTEALKKKSDDFEHAKNYYESLISGMLDILLVMDRKGNCTFINEYGQKMLGYKAHELPTKSLPNFFTDIKRLKKDYGQAVNFELRDYECPLRTKDGLELDLSWNVRYLFDNRKRFVGTMYVGRDITETKQLQKRIQEHTKNLEKLVERRTQELNRKIKQLAKIIQIGEDIVLNLDLNVILKNICEAIKTLGWEIVIISLRDFETKVSRVAAAVGISDKKFKELTQGKITYFKDILTLMKDEYKLSHSYFIDHTVQAFRLSGGRAKKSPFIRKFENQWHPGDSLLVPIKIKNKILGFITVQEPNDKMKADIEKVQALEIFANKAAVVIENARLYHQARGRAGEMERISQMKTELLANMSHELRTPLNSILSLTKILLNQIPGKLNQEQLKQLSIVEKNGRNLLRLINNLLDISKIEAGKVTVNYSCFSIRDLVKANIEMIRPISASKGLKLSVSIDKRLPQYIFSDQDKISQVLINLLSNAVKFTQKGKISLSAKAEKNNTIIKIVIRDTGIGISKDEVDKIFQDFQQLNTSAYTKAKGTGLGLSISKKLIELMDGELSVESQLNKGTTFSILLPLKAVGQDQINQAHQKVDVKSDKIRLSFAETELGSSAAAIKLKESSRPTVEQVSSAKKKPRLGPHKQPARIQGSKGKAKLKASARSTSARKHILLVDDNEDNQYAMSYFLKQKGYKISFASNGREGVEKAIELKPSLILMDIMMPGLNGYQATKILKSRKESANIPIIAMTARAMREDQIKVLQAGCDDYIAKPFSLDKIAEKIEKWLKD